MLWSIKFKDLWKKPSGLLKKISSFYFLECILRHYFKINASIKTSDQLKVLYAPFNLNRY